MISKRCRLGIHAYDETMHVEAEGHTQAKVFFEKTCRRCGKHKIVRTHVIG